VDLVLPFVSLVVRSQHIGTSTVDVNERKDGNDTFSVSVSDELMRDTITIYVTVKPGSVCGATTPSPS
jgi:hypothetical protein